MVIFKYEFNKYVEFILVNEYILGVFKMIIVFIYLYLVLCFEFYIVVRDKYFFLIKIVVIYFVINILRDGEEDF